MRYSARWALSLGIVDVDRLLSSPIPLGRPSMKFSSTMRTWRALSPFLLLLLVLSTACGTSGSDEFPNGTVDVHADFFTFPSIEAMAAESGVVIVGTVVEVKDGQFVPSPEPEDFKGTQYLAAVVDIEETLLGAHDGAQVEIRWFGYEVEADGSKGPQEIVNGELPPVVGERCVWFLKTDLPDGQIARAGGEARLMIDQDGGLTPTNAPYSGAAQQLDTMNLGELRETLASYEE